MEIIYNPSRSELDSILRERKDGAYSPNIDMIVESVAKEGEKALLSFIEKYDGIKMTAAELQVTEEEINEAANEVGSELKSAIRCAIENVAKFHKAQKREDITVETMPGVVCKQKSVPISKVGLYIPGGTAPLFSTVIMLAIPAKLAGCREIVLCTPPLKNGKIASEVLYCAKLCGVTRIFKAGGPAAIAAMAYGTETLPRVDKIFGPGNSYVTAAKQMVAKDVCAIDMPAGPSEVMIIADRSANAKFITADFLAQLEHGKDSQAILVTTSADLAKETIDELDAQISSLSRQNYILDSLQKSKIIVVESEEELIETANIYAPEHLIICTEDYNNTVGKIENAGSIFLGNYTPESAGDYASGTNHTLPTGGWARSFSGVNLASFTKLITIQEITSEGLKNLAPTIENMAQAEGLDAHANAVKVRLN
ncbi:MAG: histidinol dehydrogenase [Bacteroidales bacterium]|nr:histidinol dehydrogenase [Bacteroidales bacterium]